MLGAVASNGDVEDGLRLRLRDESGPATVKGSPG
jgi:hypothetical protein